MRNLVYGLGAVGGGLAVFGAVLEVLNSERKPGLSKECSSRRATPAWLKNLRAEEGFYEQNHPKWDRNWDLREPGEDERRRGIFPTATRHLLLIRHGQYNLQGTNDKERSLTDLGKQQAAVTAARLATLSLPYSHITHSNMTRAIETAEIVAEALPNTPVLPADTILREGAPIRPEPNVASWKPEHYYLQDGARIEAAFRKYFHRADPSQMKESYEVVVCHANVIRYFVCRALQFPPEAWLRISLKHASITWITIRPDGRVSVRGLGDSGHFPPALLTTS